MSRHNKVTTRVEGVDAQRVDAVDNRTNQVIAGFNVFKAHLWARDDNDLFNSCIDAGLQRDNAYGRIRNFVDAHGRDAVSWRRTFFRRSGV